MAPVPVATPIFVPGLVGPTPPVPNYNYLGFSELELLEFHQLIANGIPELDAVRSIQYNRLIHHHPAYVPQQMPLSRTSSGIPPVHHSIAANDEDHVYQMILRESIEEEQRRQARLRAAGHSADDLTPDEMMTIAIQQSQDEYERKKRSENQSYGSPSSINGNHSGGVYTSRNSIPKAVSKSSSKAMNSIEKANEDALRQAILLSMQETNVTPSSNSNKRTPAGKMNPSFSYNVSILMARAEIVSFHPISLFSVLCRIILPCLPHGTLWTTLLVLVATYQHLLSLAVQTIRMSIRIMD